MEPLFKHAHPSKYCNKLSLQIPNITEIQPNYGPRVGGTLITVTGPHLDAGKTRKVTLNDMPCPIKRSGIIYFFVFITLTSKWL